MKKLVVFVLAFSLLLSLVSLSAAEEYDTFIFPYENYSYQVPTGWIFQQKTITDESGDEEFDAPHVNVHFAKEEESISGGALAIVAIYAMDDMDSQVFHEALIEGWVEELAERERMDLKKMEELTVENTIALRYAGYMNTDTEKAPVNVIAWEDLGILYAMIYTNPDYNPDQVEEFIKSLLARVDFLLSQEISPEYEIIKEYKWQSSIAYHNDLLIKNTSGYDAIIYLDVLFFDKDGNVVGVTHDAKGGCEDGYETYWSISNDLPFDYIEYEFFMVPDTENQGLQSLIKLSTNVLENNKVIISATNIGDKPIGMLECFVLFMDENGNVVDYAWEFLGDSDAELKPGATLYEQVKTTQNYEAVKFFATSLTN